MNIQSATHTSDVRDRSLCEPALVDLVHAVRGRLATIRNYSEILLEAPPDDEVQRRQFLRIVLGETDALAAMLADLMLLREPDGRPCTDTIAVSELVAAALTTCREVAARRHIQLIADIADVAAAESRVCGDANDLVRVLTELIDNAIKFSRDHSVVRIGVVSTADRVMIRVDDDGPGVRTELSEQIFAPFFQGESASDPLSARGDGLGLSVARTIARQHGGDVRVLSVESGASFAIELPLAASVAKPNNEVHDTILR